MPDDDTEPNGKLTPSETNRLETLRAKISTEKSEFQLKLDDEKNRFTKEKEKLIEFLHSHDLPTESAERLESKNYQPAVRRAEKILGREKAVIAREHSQNTPSKERIFDIRNAVSLFTIAAINKLFVDPDTKHSTQYSKTNPDKPWLDFSRNLQTDEGPILIKGVISPQNQMELTLEYTSQYLSPINNSLKSVTGVFKSNDSGEFRIYQDVKNYDTGRTTSERHEFFLSDRTMTRETLEAAIHAQELLDIYLEEN